GDDPQARQIGDAVELVAGHHTLAIDDALDDHRAARRRRPVDGARIGAGLPHLADAVLGNREVAQALHGAVEAALRVQTRAAALRRPDRDDEIGLRLLDLRAVDPEQRLALADDLAGGVDEQVLDVAVRAQRHDGQTTLVIGHRPNAADRLN